MKNNKGFTLVELLAVVVILIIVISLITPKVFNQLKTAEKITDQEQINAIIDTSKLYMNQHSELLPEHNSLYVITLNELKESGLIKTSQILNPSTKEELTGCVVVNYENNKYKYEYSEASGWCNRPQIVTSGDGLYKSETEPARFIYRGSNPDNYIILKENNIDTTYRIVSYETDGTIKVVRNEQINSGMAWDSSNVRTGDSNTYCSSPANGCNVWGNQTNTLYNGESLGDSFHYSYYASNVATALTNGGSGKVESDSSLNTYLNGTWLESTGLSNYIEGHDFNVGGINYSSSYTGRNKGLAKETEEEKTLTWNGKIGLLNITEYVESSTNSSCTDTWSNYYYNSDNVTNRTSNEWPCKYDNYNYKSGYTQWSLSPITSSSFFVWSMKSSGYFDHNGGANYPHGVRPAFYLKAQISLTGDGTETDPYRINT